MNKENTIKRIYGLEYDLNPEHIKYSLPVWYNQLPDKTIEELTDLDILRMVRQDILKDVALNKIIDRFLEEPDGGEQGIYEFLECLILNSHEDIIKKRKEELISKIKETQDNIELLDWDLEEDKDEYENNLSALLDKINT